MIPPHYIIVVLLLFIANLVLFQYHQRLYIKNYKKHVILIPQTVTSTRYPRFGLVYVVLFALTTALLLYQQADYEYYLRLFFGSIIGALVPLSATLISQILYYKYIESNPSEVSGTLTLSPGTYKQLAIAILIQILIPLVAIMIAIPDPFIYGFALVILLQITLLSLNLIRIKTIM